MGSERATLIHIDVSGCVCEKEKGLGMGMGMG